MTPAAAERAPVLAVAGGAGAMGSLFAELLLPRVRAALLVDRFPSGEADGAPRPTLLGPLVERLAAVLARQGYDAHLLAFPASYDRPRLLPPREARAAPAWLLGAPIGAPPRLPDALPCPRDPAAVFDALADQIAGPIVGLLTPADATAAARVADIVLLATPYPSDAQLAAVVAPYAASMRPGSLLADLLSVKEAPLRLLDGLLPPAVGLLGMHPLFGRVVGDVTGLVTAVTPAGGGRAVSPWQPWLLRQLTGLGMLLTPTSAAEHDAAMSYVQALSHFALLCFAFTFVRANQDPTLLLPYRTPVFEPLLYLAARVAALAQRTPEVYRAIQEECARPELRRLFVQTAEDLLRAIEADAAAPGDSASLLTDLLQTLGAPWSPSYHQHAEPYEHLTAMSNALTEPINALRHALLQSAGQVRGLRQTRTGAVTVGALYVDPLHHDRVDLASRVRYRRLNLVHGVLAGPDEAELAALPPEERRQRLEAALSSAPLAQVQLLTDDELLRWLDANTGPRVGADDGRGGPGAPSRARPRYAGKRHYDLSLLLPDWYDDDCLGRLLAWRAAPTGVIGTATLRPQAGEGPRAPKGLRAVIVQITVLLPPATVLSLRQDARQASTEARSVSRSWLRQVEDRRLAALLAERHQATRQFALEWLLAHGGTTSAVAPPAP